MEQKKPRPLTKTACILGIITGAIAILGAIGLLINIVLLSNVEGSEYLDYLPIFILDILFGIAVLLLSMILGANSSAPVEKFNKTPKKIAITLVVLHFITAFVNLFNLFMSSGLSLFWSFVVFVMSIISGIFLIVDLVKNNSKATQTPESPNNESK